MTFPAVYLAIPEQRKVLQSIKIILCKKGQTLEPIIAMENIVQKKQKVNGAQKLEDEIESETEEDGVVNRQAGEWKQKCLRHKQWNPGQDWVFLTYELERY